MADGFTVTYKGERELLRQLRRIDDALDGDALSEELVDAAEPIRERASQLVHRVSGDLAESLEVRLVSQTRDSADVVIASDSPYARRQELGFVGVDSLGRHYHEAGHPYLRPAFDERRDQALGKAKSGLAARLRRAAR